MGRSWCPAPADKMTEQLQSLLGTQHNVLRRGCPGKALRALLKHHLPRTIQEPSPPAQHPCHTFPPLPGIGCVSGQKHTAAIRNIHLPSPASKNTVTQPEHVWTNWSMERDPFRGGCSDTKSETPLQLCPFPSILLSPSLNNSPDSHSKMEKEDLCLPLSLSLSPACLYWRMV